MLNLFPESTTLSFIGKVQRGLLENLEQLKKHVNTLILVQQKKEVMEQIEILILLFDLRTFSSAEMSSLLFFNSNKSCAVLNCRERRKKEVIQRR